MMISTTDKKKNIETIYPLSPMQQGMLFHTLLTPQAGLYTPQVCLSIAGTLNIAAFQQAWQVEVDQNQPLRAAFYWEQRDTPFQIVFRQVALPWQVLDWRSTSDPSQQLAQFLQADRAQGFNLKQPPLMRLTLIQYQDDAFWLIWTQHHLLLDGWSVALLLQRIFTRYLQPDRALPSSPAYGSYISWLKQQDAAAAETFWRNYLQGFTQPTQLQTVPVVIDSSKLDSTHRSLKHQLTPASVAPIKTFIQTQKITLNTLFQAAFAVAQGRFSNQTDIVFGITTAGRPTSLPESDRMIGLFINTLPVRVKLDRTTQISTWLQDLQQQQSAALAYEYSALIDIQGWSEVLGPLFESLLVFENYPIEPGELTAQSNLRVADIQSIEWTNFPLTLLVSEGAGITLELKYDVTRFTAADIEQYLDYLRLYLTEIPQMGDASLAQLSSLTAMDQQAIAAWNQTTADYPEVSIHQQFVAQVAKTPDGIALRFETAALSYANLNHRANQLAHYLCQQGLGLQQPVGVRLLRSPELVIALLAIIKAGGMYVPIDPEYPHDRQQHLIAQTQLEFLLTTAGLPELAVDPAVQNLIWDQISHQVNQQPTSNLPHLNQLDDPLYILHTSGSTGVPKGVVISHRSISNRLHWMQQQYPLTAADRVLQKTPYSFDVSVWEFLWPLLTGATLILAKPGGHRDIDYLAEVIQTAGVTTLHFVPSMLQIFLELPQIPDCIRQVFASGEVLSQDLVTKFLSRSTAQLYNLYGPTEAAIDVTYYDCSANDPAALVPIGRPIANTQIHILDNQGQSAPIGVAGELYIGGVGLATGYWQQPELTQERFIQSPWGRLYRTGDRARWSASGQLMYLGRTDRQVKLRGFRIELGEIETVLQQHPQVQQSAVVLHQSASGPQLVAYIVLEGSALVESLAALPNFLAKRLPHYMLPSNYLSLDRFPTTANGKLNWQALPAPDAPAIVADRLPQTPTEKIIAEIWCNVLKLESVGVVSNLFEIGGHSLIATRINSRLREAFQIELPLQSMFVHPTIEQMAAHIAQLQNPTKQQSTIPAILRPPVLPLSFAQQRLWFLEQLQPGTGTYNIPIAVKIAGNLDIATLNQAFNDLIVRHEGLRSQFVSEDGQPQVKIRSASTFDLPIVDLRSLDATARPAAIQREMQQQASLPFDLATDLLLRVVLLQCHDAESILLLTVHHIVTDGWSMTLLLQELGEIYSARSLDRPVVLPDLPIQYLDFAVWQREQLQGDVLDRQLTYWQQQLAEPRSVLQLPTDFPRSRIQTFQGAVHQFTIDRQLSQQLQRLAQSEGTTLFVLLLSVYKLLLAKYTGQTDITVGCPIANRQRVELEGIIGLFVNTLVLRSAVDDTTTFQTLLQQLREQTYQAYDHQDLPFERLVEALQPERDLSYNPLFQVKFRLENAPTEVINLPGITLQKLPQAEFSSKLDLSLDMYETADGLVGGFEYNQALFEPATIARMSQHFTNLLNAVVTQVDQPIATIDLLSITEREQLLVGWNQTTIDYPQDQLFHQLFEHQVAQNPDAIALTYQDTHLTYTQLNQQSNQLARHLQSLGVQPETIVGICIDRSFAMIVAMLAVFKSGGAYLPLDPNYPAERLAFMVDDAAITVLLTQSDHRDRLPPTKAAIVAINQIDNTTYSDQNFTSPAGINNLAYLIYTSGSTGKPKGVLVEHTGLVNLTLDKIRVCDVRLGDRILQFFSFSFDASIPEIVMSLGAGATLCLASNVELLPGPGLLRLLQSQRITHVTITPSALTQVPAADLPDLRMVLVGGEAPSPDLINQWSVGRHFINAYGPTETTVNASMVECGNGQSLLPSIRPSANKQLYVLDRQLQPLPIGVLGELYIGGVGLARGYHRRPEVTASRFHPNPWRSGDRIYQTGDLAEVLPDGRIRLKGRVDEQVKVRGFRIELAEIETVLRQNPQVTAAVVIVREIQPNNPQILAYVTGHSKSGINPELRQFLRQKLPEYMVPSAIINLAQLPLTPNGKIDLKALPNPQYESESIIGPRNAMETELQNIFQTILQLPQVGINDDFFELGGHSLLATQLIAQVLELFHIELTVMNLFEAPTIAGLAEQIMRQRLTPGQASAVAVNPINAPEREEFEL